MSTILRERALLRWWVAKQDVASDPLVWCDCFRDTLPLSSKVHGGRCAACHHESSEVAA